MTGRGGDGGATGRGRGDCGPHPAQQRRGHRAEDGAGENIDQSEAQIPIINQSEALSLNIDQSEAPIPNTYQSETPILNLNQL